MKNKISKKLFKRKLSYFELYTILSGISVAIFSIFKGNGNFIPLIFGMTLLYLVFIFIKHKQKDVVLISFISILGLLLFVNMTFPLTTVFSPQGIGVPPQTYQECKDISGIAILNQNCPNYYIEVGNAGEKYICCLPDTCEGTWERIYNQETKIFEKVCNG